MPRRGRQVTRRGRTRQNEEEPRREEGGAAGRAAPPPSCVATRSRPGPHTPGRPPARRRRFDLARLRLAARDACSPLAPTGDPPRAATSRAPPGGGASHRAPAHGAPARRAPPRRASRAPAPRRSTCPSTAPAAAPRHLRARHIALSIDEVEPAVLALHMGLRHLLRPAASRLAAAPRHAGATHVPSLVEVVEPALLSLDSGPSDFRGHGPLLLRGLRFARHGEAGLRRRESVGAPGWARPRTRA